jgi:hypothetical protein
MDNRALAVKNVNKQLTAEILYNDRVHELAVDYSIEELIDWLNLEGNQHMRNILKDAIKQKSLMDSHTRGNMKNDYPDYAKKRS